MTVTEAEDTELVQKLRQLFIAARDARKPRQDNWNRNLRLLHNKLQTSGISSWQPQPKSSEIYPTISAIVAWMMDNNISVDCIPSSDPGSPYYHFISKLANDLSAVLYTNYIVEEYAKAIKLVLWDAATVGIGIFKSIWDNERAGGLGNAVLTRIDPWSFFVDPYATSLSDMTYCVEVKRMTLEEVARRYPDSRASLQNASGMDVQFEEKPRVNSANANMMMANPGQLPGSGTFGSTGSNIVGQFGQPHNRRDFIDADKTIFIYEYWMRENETWYDEEEEKHVMSRWRVVVTAHGEILMDEYADELWSHGGHPYDTVLFDDIGDFYGIALCDHLAQPQIYINRLLSMLQQNAELIGNPIFLESPQGGTIRQPVVNRPGLRFQVSGPGGMQANKPDWLRPPEMPSSIMELLQYWKSAIESISGLSAITKGATPSQRNAEGVINSIQEAAFVRIRATLSNLESSLESAFSKIADLIIDNYDQKRIMAIVGPDGEKTAAVLFAHHWHLPSKDGDLPMEYLVQIRAGSSTPTSRQARIAEADKLYGMGALDDQAVLEAHQYPHIDENLTRLYEKRQKGILGGGPASRQRSARR